MVFLGLNGVRVLVAGVLGLYPRVAVFSASVAAVVPAIVGVSIGTRLRGSVSDRQREAIVLGLLAVIGVRLLLGGLGVA